MASEIVATDEVMLDISKFPDDLLENILARVVAPESVDHGNAAGKRVMLVCKPFRAVLLRAATRAIVSSDQQAPPFARCFALREMHLRGRCTRLPWHDADAPDGQPHPLARLTALTRLQIGPTLSNVVFDAASLAALRHCSRLRSLHLAFQTADPTALQHLLPLSRLRELYVDIHAPNASAFFASQNTLLTSESFSVLSTLMALERLHVPHDQSFVDAISSLHTLTALRYLDVQRLTLYESTYECLRRLPALEELHAGELTWRSDDLARLAEFPALRHFSRRSSSSMWHWDAHDIERLAALTHLEHLDLRARRLNDVDADAVSPLRRLAHLTSLILCDCNVVTDAAMEHLCSLSLLRHLELPDCRGDGVSSEGFAHVSQLTALQSLVADTTFDSTQAVMQCLAGLTNLTRLFLSDHRKHNVTDRMLVAISELPQLQWLSLQANSVSDGAVARLSKLTGLRQLHLHCARLIDVGLPRLTALGRLERLVLGWECERVTDHGILQLCDFTRLRDLELPPSVTDAGLRCLGSLPLLTRLQLQQSSGVSDAGLACVGGLTALRALSLRQCPQLTEAGLAHLSALTSLTELAVVACRKLTITGMESLLSHLTLDRVEAGGLARAMRVEGGTCADDP